MSPSSPTDFLFTVMPGEETWTIVGPGADSPPHVVPNPLAERDFRLLVEKLRVRSDEKFPPDQEADIRYYEDLARELSDRITSVLLSDDARHALRVRLNQVHRKRARLTIRVTEKGHVGDRALALPWELVAPTSGEFPVRQSVLEIVRESFIPGAPELPEPTLSLAVAVAVAAPEGEAALAYEKEEVRLQTVLEPLGHAVAFTDLGTLDELVELVDRHHATAILFSGHGLPGRLLFEDRLGFAQPVTIEGVARRLRSVLLDPDQAGSFPSLFFLSSCDSAESGVGPSSPGPSSAAALHRAGFPQVIGYFGPVRDSAASQAEQAFFKALSSGQTALQAAHLARASLVDEIEHEGESFVFPLAWTQFAIYHRGADRPLAAGGRKLGRSLPPRFRRRQDDRNGVPVLTQGFIGRRPIQHEILRKVTAGERLVVLHGLGGSGKTALASQMLTRRLALSLEPASALFLQIPPLGKDVEPLLSLRRQAESHGRNHALPGWEERIARIQGRVPAPLPGFAETLRALQETLPHSPLTVLIDRMDHLQNPRRGGSDTSRPGDAEWWKEIEALAAHGILVLASTRWASGNLPSRCYVGVPPLSASDAFRMMAFFVELSDLNPQQRSRLADWSEGHPRTIELLDRAIARRRQNKGLGYECTEPWKELVEPCLPEVAEAIRHELQLRELWMSLPETARDHARRLVAVGKPLPVTEIDELGGERDVLIRSGLLVRHLQEVCSTDGHFQWVDHWKLPLRLCEVITGKSDQDWPPGRVLA